MPDKDTCKSLLRDMKVIGYTTRSNKYYVTFSKEEEEDRTFSFEKDPHEPRVIIKPHPTITDSNDPCFDVSWNIDIKKVKNPEPSSAYVEFLKIDPLQRDYKMSFQVIREVFPLIIEGIFKEANKSYLLKMTKTEYILDKFKEIADIEKKRNEMLMKHEDTNDTYIDTYIPINLMKAGLEIKRTLNEKNIQEMNCYQGIYGEKVDTNCKTVALTSAQFLGINSR